MKVLAEKVQNQKGMAYSKSLESRLTKVAQLDFTSKRKAMSVVVSGYKSERDLLLKGAPDRILAKCTKLMTPDGAKPMGQDERETLER